MNTNQYFSAFSYAITDNTGTSKEYAAKARILKSPRLQRAMKKHPDLCCTVPYIWIDYEGDATVEVSHTYKVGPEDGLGIDLANLPGVEVDELGYYLTNELSIPLGTTTLKLILTARQDFTAEEKDLLRDIGKLVTRVTAWERTALECGTT